MKIAKTSTPLGESLSMIALFALTSVGIICVIALSSGAL